jgi:hypothetical protein
MALVAAWKVRKKRSSARMTYIAKSGSMMLNHTPIKEPMSTVGIITEARP